MRRTWLLAVLALLNFALLPGAAAEDLEAIQQRMKERLAKIAELKEKHIVGESRDGLLEIAAQDQADKEAKTLVAAENGDRKTLYEALAKKHGMSTAKIGRARAKMIYEREEPGALLQKPDGTWYKKPE
jgi:hypothetical protein